ncbi:hypothetical protein H0H81_011859 [Sphagnurus paluster]|uniref:DNL-type domain-containing protein n=1 Tax=Sphagnurus paluster TaxID=117069 RepID=A0A9P7GNH4_9AGAR|nr:hypothetical protein H0H81_011859 [Sphagnurus paluster]
MLPSRLFRNTGVPPALRSLIIPRASLPPTVSVQLRLRLGVSVFPSSSTPSSQAPYSTTSPRASTPLSPPPQLDAGAADGVKDQQTTTSQALPNKMEPRLSMTFTCTAPGCSERSTHEFTKRSYTRGIVLVQCPGCKNRHLIADHLGWFKDDTEGGKLRTVEDILAARGEVVRRGRIDMNGDIEYSE